jgi:predicted neutral ceramidase superfamily lipid hydrolase
VNFAFPFLLVFAITYGLLERTQIFGSKHDVNAVIALVLGLIFATTSWALHLAQLILPAVALLAVIAFFIIVLAQFVSGSATLEGRLRKIVGIIVGIVSLIIILVFVVGPLIAPSIPSIYSGFGSYIGYIFGLVFVLIIIWIVTR